MSDRQWRLRAGWHRIPGTTDSRPKTALAGTAADPGPGAVDSSAFRGALWTAHQVIVKLAEKRWFSDIRSSPHILNDEEDVTGRSARSVRSWRDNSPSGWAVG